MDSGYPDLLYIILTGNILTVLYFYVMEFRFPLKITVAAAASVILLGDAAYTFGLLWLKAPAGTVFMLTLAIPGFLLSLFMVKAWRFQGVFMYCANHLMGFMAALLGKLLPLHFQQSRLLCYPYLLLFLVPWILLVIRVRKPLRQIMHQMNRGWAWLALLVLLFYVQLHFMLWYPQPLGERMEYVPVAVGFCAVVAAAFIVIGVALQNIYRVGQMEAKQQQLTAAIRESREILEHKQLLLMVSQIQPHFINNTLNSINVLLDKDTVKARKMLQDFSIYLRDNLQALEDVGLVPFSEELRHIRAYTDIERQRFPKIKMEYRLEAGDFGIVSLSLQPLIENAFRHGVAPKYGGGTVWLRTRREGGDVLITIEDDGVGFRTETVPQHSVGIKNVRYRLEQQMGAQLRLISGKGKGTTVVIRIPFIEVKRFEDNTGR